MKRFLLLLLALPVVGGLSSCSSQVEAKRPVSYHFESGKTAMLQGGLAYAPRNAPDAVKRAVAAGNRLQGKPYKWGGGHANGEDWGYDCSGTVSYVLRSAGLMKGVGTSKDYFSYGNKGEGRWITIYTRKGHVFMTIAGLRLDTGGRGGGDGPRWRPQTRSAKGTVMRHPDGL
ncbi:C40 family peptidase [Luteolibacter ambystomatis]|uniref:C40 family peptidase n=1 Tax=Luteolibacter ambystomatis TaxID=2824561 RepID=A0A975G744_9BACT|nr:NlpC/P60 family protein [Luteolibacter ambystomatis]QUE50547.1 C40 family peptidase [Luteolibacter ambystomatis]